MDAGKRFAFAKVIIDISHEKVDRMFSYRIPDALRESVTEGVCVTVPFGRGNTPRKAFVTELTDDPGMDPALLKEISQVNEGELPVQARSIALAAWMKKRYGSTMITALKTVLPVKKKVKPVSYKEVTALVPDTELAALRREAFLKHQSGKVRLLGALSEGVSVAYGMLTGRLSVSPATIKSMEKQGVLRIDTYETYRSPIRFEKDGDAHPSLTPEQQKIADAFLSDYDKGIRRPALLYGITGSGKTEIYMEIIEGILKRGRQVIVLIPEIALTYQTVRRFYRRFGEVIAILNSRMSEGEKFDQLERVRTGEASIMIGPRSALFTPFENLGLLIIDEEHESSYKSEIMPRYHAREVAKTLCEMSDARLLLGSATPSLDSYYRAMNGEYSYYALTKRIGEAVLPEVEITDLRKELAAGNFSIFGRRLQTAIAEHLEKQEQIMLFLNRRGIAGFVSCKSCGEVLRCPHCDVSLTDHKMKMVCHYCGYETPRPTLCPSCGSKHIYGFKAGTWQVEEEARKRFPGARILRMDADTTKKKDDYDKILAAFSAHEADILIGTQMIVKGHDFPLVTLVGVLAADQSLFSADYAASERTFQLLTQAVGRAGRGQRRGEAIIQTYKPEHFAVQMAAKQDYVGFYEEEIADRRLLDFPPAGHLLAVLMTGEDEEKLISFADWLVHGLTGMFEKKTQPRILGPAPASIGKIKDRYRRVVYIKSPDIEVLVRVKDLLEDKLERIGKAGDAFLVTFDFDPLSGY